MASFYPSDFLFLSSGFLPVVECFFSNVGERAFLLFLFFFYLTLSPLATVIKRNNNNA